MEIGLCENYKFTNLSIWGGQAQSPPPGHTETNKLRDRLRNWEGGVQPPPPRQFAP